MDYTNLVSTYRHGALKILGVETSSSKAIWACIVAMMCTSPISLIILGYLSAVSAWRYCQNYLSGMGYGVFLYFSVEPLISQRYNWTEITIRLQRRIKAELRSWRTVQQNIKNQLRQELSLHLDQAAEIADWAVIPPAIMQDRINRRKTIMILQKGATVVRIRREIYSRALSYVDAVKERKRGQRGVWQDVFLASWIYAYFVLLWFFELAFASIWGVMSWFELALVYMTGP
ncbi:hypothetical protein FANTH_2006 [Fusarium anthophilum]|uniref:Uncharacterized protein n=1 Tax=Fusarium anthophilum TaxID=48485 RepID=A0A8H4ZUK0_9HYPO|nr:hypothetical protein FANTH_2006 [Fusarium anthophilum]